MNINETVIPCLDPDVTECFKCGGTPVGQVNGRLGFCDDHRDPVIAAATDPLEALTDLGVLTIDVEIVPTAQASLDAQYAELAKRGEDLARRIAAGTQELDKIKAQLREMGPGAYSHGGRTLVTVGDNPRKFDENLARTVLTLEQQAQVTKTTIDGNAVKVLFGEQVHDACRKDQGGKAPVSFPGAK